VGPSKAGRIGSLAELLDPVEPEIFAAEYLHKRSLHIRGHPDKFRSVLTWDDINRMLVMDVWSPQSLQLFVDTHRVPPAAYCVSAVNRNHQQVMRPDPGKVQAMIARGASLLLNEIESLAPGVLAVVETVQRDLGAKSSSNLYLSCKERQGFDSHCDRHDVFAVQIYGTKRWNIYRGQLDNPIEHAMFQNVPQADYDRLKGPVAEVVEAQPGDILYLPRGKFHDALATSEVSVHLSVACNEPNGLDWLGQLWNLALRDAAFRAVLPRPGGPAGDAALNDHLRRLFERLGTIAFDPKGLRIAKDMRRGYGIERGHYDLPDLPPPRDVGGG
jgi:ribosomal protein L16 Arg81 hydroxylase